MYIEHKSVSISNNFFQFVQISSAIATLGPNYEEFIPANIAVGPQWGLYGYQSKFPSWIYCVFH